VHSPAPTRLLLSIESLVLASSRDTKHRPQRGSARLVPLMLPWLLLGERVHPPSAAKPRAVTPARGVAGVGGARGRRHGRLTRTGGFDDLEAAPLTQRAQLLLLVRQGVRFFDFPGRTRRQVYTCSLRHRRRLSVGAGQPRESRVSQPTEPDDSLRRRRVSVPDLLLQVRQPAACVVPLLPVLEPRQQGRMARDPRCPAVHPLRRVLLPGE